MERDVTAGQLLLAEYACVKDEQKARIGFRDNLLYVTLTAVAAVVVTTAQSRQTSMLLALPPVCLVLGWTYLMNDQKISAIGGYVRDDLGPRLARLAGVTEGEGPGRERVFGWETAHRGDGRRAVRKAIQCVVDLTAFCVVPLVGLLVYWASGQGGGLLVALSVFEALVVAGLAVQVVQYAGLFARRARPGPEPGPGPERAPEPRPSAR